jgi:hypothetical protein
MYTSALYLALAVVSPTAEMIPVAPSPSWRSNYTLALKEGQSSKRPLAIFVGSGSEGWDQVSKDGAIDKETKELLHDRYVCLYLDSSKDEARSLISKLSLADRPGLVIGDAKGESQAFWHSGTIGNADLNRTLRKYSDPDLVVVRTERLGTSQPVSVSSRPAAAVQPTYTPQPYYAPQPFYAPSISSGRVCST